MVDFCKKELSCTTLLFKKCYKNMFNFFLEGEILHNDKCVVCLNIQIINVH